MLIKRKGVNRANSWTDRKNVNLGHGLWKNHDPDCETIELWNCKTLNLENSKREFVLKDIRQIQFPSLTNIILAKNLIESIEPLSRLSMPSLTILDISHNRLCSLRGLRKANLPKLTTLHIEGNQIIDCGSQMGLVEAHQPRLEALSIEYLFYNKPMCPDLSFYAKLESNKTKSLYIENSQRIRQKRLLLHFKGKCSGFRSAMAECEVNQEGAGMDEEKGIMEGRK